jgi:hypothetical protein
MLRKRLFGLGLFVALLAGLLFSANFTVQAQEPVSSDGGEVDPVTVQITGTLEYRTGEISIGQGGITVDGVKVAPASGFQPSGYADGDCVTVTGYFLESDVLQVFKAERSQDCSDEVVDTDTDGDGVPDDQDNCPEEANADQLNTDGDEFGDACDPDIDNDGVPNDVDICPTVSNPDQVDVDADGNDVPDECENTGDENQNEEQNQEQEGCTNGHHPVLEAYAEEFATEEVPPEELYAELEGWFCEDHMGMGEIGRALLMGEALADDSTTCGDKYTSYGDVLQARADGENWGALKKECGIKGSDLAPGRVISGHHQQNTEGTTSQQESVSPGNSGNHGNSGNNPGHSGNPPGQDKEKDKGKDNNPGKGHGKNE